MTRPLFSIALGLLALASRNTAVAQQEVLVPAGAWLEGPALVCAIHGQTALVGSGARISSYDLGNPAVPLLMGRTALPFEPNHLAWEGGTVAVLTGTRGEFAVADLSNLAAPALSGLLELGGAPRGLALDDTLAFVSVQVGPSHWQTELRVVDLSDPQDAIQLHAWSASDAGHLEVDAGRLYVGSSMEIRVYDVAQPTAPALLSWIPGYEPSFGDFVVDGDRLYSPFVIWDAGNGFQVVDISDPGNPVQLGYSLDCYGNLVGVRPPWLYGQCDSFAMTAFDFSDPTAPVPAGSVPLAGSATEADNTTDLLVAASGGDLSIVSLEQPDLPQVWATLDHPAGTDLVLSDGSFAWLAQRGRIQTLDVRDPAAVDSLGSYSTGEDWGSLIWRMSRQGDTLLAGRLNDLLALRADSAGFLHPLASFPGGWQAALQDGILCVAVPGSGLRIYDVADWSAPVLLATLPLGDTRGVVRLGDLAVVLTNQNRVLQVANLHHPGQPQILGQWTSPDGVYAMALADSLLYLGTMTGLDWLDLTQPDAPVLAGSLNLPHGVRTMAISGRHLLAGRMDEAWLGVFELVEDGTPVQVQTLELRGSNAGMACVGNQVYLPAGNRGLTILRNTLAPEPDFAPTLTVSALPNHRLGFQWDRHPAPAGFRLERAVGPEGPWETLLLTRDCTCTIAITGGMARFRVIQTFD